MPSSSSPLFTFTQQRSKGEKFDLLRLAKMDLCDLRILDLTIESDTICSLRSIHFKQREGEHLTPEKCSRKNLHNSKLLCNHVSVRGCMYTKIWTFGGIWWEHVYLSMLEKKLVSQWIRTKLALEKWEPTSTDTFTTLDSRSFVELMSLNCPFSSKPTQNIWASKQAEQTRVSRGSSMREAKGEVPNNFLFI